MGPASRTWKVYSARPQPYRIGAHWTSWADVVQCLLLWRFRPFATSTCPTMTICCTGQIWAGAGATVCGRPQAVSSRGLWACRIRGRSNISFGVGAGHKRNRAFRSRKARLPACAFPVPFRLKVCSIPTYETAVAAVYRRCPGFGGITRSTQAPHRVLRQAQRRKLPTPLRSQRTGHALAW
jgi:hypothetical protein